MASLFTRALAGVGKEAAGLANKYVDESLAQSRAQMLADLQVQTAGRMRADEDAFKNDPTRIARDRQNQVENVKAVGGAQNQVALEGERAKATDTVLQGALTKNEMERRQAAADVDTQAMRDRLPLEVQRAVQIADAQGRTAAKYRERPPSVADKVADIERVLGRPLTEQEKLGALGMAPKEAADKYTALPIRDADNNITGYQAFDTRRGTFVKEAPKGPASEQEAHAQAQAAIAAGADPAAVNARLQQSGFAPVGGKKDDKPKARPLMERGAEASPRPSSMDDEIKRAMQPIQADRAGFAERQANKAKAEADPDLKALDDQRAQLLRAGKARDANAVIEQMNALRKERYGF